LDYLTFGDVKEQLALVTDNGVGTTDPRVMVRANEAIKALMDEGIWVGSMMTVTLSVSSPIFSLPPEMENVIEARQLDGARDVRDSFYEVINRNVYIDPTLQHDNSLIDRGEIVLSGNRVRQYEWPQLDFVHGFAAIRLTGLKRWLPITQDSDILLIQNVRAIKLMILSIEKGENRNWTDAKDYLGAARDLLTSEVKRYMLDPSNALERNADYQQDLATYAEGTLGNTRAKLALELQSLRLRGKTEIGYLINKSVQMLVDHRNEVLISGRIGVHASVSELAYTPATAAASALSWSDYNQIRLMVQSFVLESYDDLQQKDPTLRKYDVATLSQELQKRAYDLQEAQLAEDTALARHTTYENVLANSDPTMMGYAVARLALDLPDGLKMTSTEIRRLANSAESRLIDRGKWKGTIDEFEADIATGCVLFPRDTQTILAASLCGEPIRIQGRFFEYHENGPGFLDPTQRACAAMLIDQGEVTMNTGAVRRKYKVMVPQDSTGRVRVLAKRRWIIKEDLDTLVIRNYEALRLTVQAILAERQGQVDVAGAFESQAIDILTKELQEYQGGSGAHLQVQIKGSGLRRMKAML
jgi:hypothetical protein